MPLVRTSKPRSVSLGIMPHPRFSLVMAALALVASWSSAQRAVTVRAGDSLSTIAQAHDTDVATLMRLNDLSSDTITVGDSLYIEPAHQQVEVQWGETLSDIAERYQISVSELIAMNDLDNPSVRVGQFLRVPAADAALQASETTEDSSPAQSTEPSPPQVRGDVYQVIIQPGDTLSTIAAEYQVEVDTLMTLNNLSSSYIRIGDVLFVSALSQPQALERITVAAGESLSLIASRHSISVTDLMRANNLDSVNIRAGQTLLLPRNARKPSDAPPEFYIVKPNDALYNIALEYGLTIEALTAANNLEGATIYPGQVLNLRAQPKVRQPLRVTVAQHETLSHLAARYDVSVADIAHANGISSARTLRIGQELLIPERFAEDAVHVAASNQTSSGDIGGIARESIVVARGDSLSAIAKRYNTNVAALLAENALSSTRIRAGQRLFVTPGEGLLPNAAQQSSPSDNTSIIWPLRGEVTSYYGHRSLNGYTSNHTGIDIDGVMGQDIVAATSGTVIHSGQRGTYGRTVIIRQGNHDYLYAHASALLVSAGEQVQQGQVIARVGNSGRVYSRTGDGSHLHFEIRVSGRAVNPWNYLEHASR